MLPYFVFIAWKLSIRNSKGYAIFFSKWILYWTYRTEGSNEYSVNPEGPLKHHSWRVEEGRRAVVLVFRWILWAPSCIRYSSFCTPIRIRRNDRAAEQRPVERRHRSGQSKVRRKLYIRNTHACTPWTVPCEARENSRRGDGRVVDSLCKPRSGQTSARANKSVTLTCRSSPLPFVLFVKYFICPKLEPITSDVRSFVRSPQWILSLC